jgi:RNA polymerase sigma-70 factor (TIGR02960 family)
MTQQTHDPEPFGSEVDAIAAALGGDEQAFAAITRPYQRELHIHCYRMLGSLDDADDAMQETLLRAWRHLGTFKPNAPVRAWLYRIATNVCLTALTGRSRRNEVTTSALIPAGSGRSRGDIDTMRLDPYPDRLVDELTAPKLGPEAVIELQESIELAFVSAVQLLPPRQRAVLLMRDVIGYPAAEVAEMLASSVTSVNSALQRARVTIRQQRSAGIVSREHAPTSLGAEQGLVRRLIDAWESADIDGLVATLTEDAVLSMPPLPDRYVGRTSIGSFLSSVPGGGRGRLDRFRLVPIRANRQPAVAAYFRDDDSSVFVAHAVMVLAVEGDAIASLVRFANRDLFARFGLPLEFSDQETGMPS